MRVLTGHATCGEPTICRSLQMGLGAGGWARVPTRLLMYAAMSAQAYSRLRGVELVGQHRITAADLEPFGLSLSPLPFMLTQLRDPGL